MLPKTDSTSLDCWCRAETEQRECEQRDLWPRRSGDGAFTAYRGSFAQPRQRVPCNGCTGLDNTNSHPVNEYHPRAYSRPFLFFKFEKWPLPPFPQSRRGDGARQSTDSLLFSFFIFRWDGSKNLVQASPSFSEFCTIYFILFYYLQYNIWLKFYVVTFYYWRYGWMLTFSFYRLRVR